MMSQKATKVTGWVMTILLALLFGMSGFMKLTLNPTALEQAAALGVEANTFRVLGVIEVVSLILFIIPRTGVVGSLLLIAYMGGVISTHVQHQQPLAMVIVMESLIWITAALRFPELARRLFSGDGNYNVSNPTR